VGNEGLDVVLAQQHGEVLNARPTVTEDETLFAAV
jgi:hypothetical protein